VITATWHVLAERFGLGPVTADPVYVTRGLMGEVWSLETTAGRFAVKYLFPWAESDARPADVATQLAAASAGIRLPLPVLAPDGTAVADAGGRLARVYEWAELGAPVIPPASAAVAGQAGHLLGLLHSLSLHADEPVDPWFVEVPGPDYWADLTQRARRADAGWAARLAAAGGLVAELSELAVPPSGRAPVVCHRDFNPDNVFPAADDGRLVVLDWENSGPLSPDRELGYAVFAWSAGAGRFDRAAARALLAGYAGACAVAPDLGPDFFGTAVATHVNLLSVMAELALTEPERRERAEESVASLLDHDLPDLRSVTRLGPADLR
jgi:Ser/Thr protein kinase RdoA (MazF antagonist)